ncbi:MAG: hypothetical protein H7Y14_06410 [Burkholderiales bacterium]|nr:hypothetical protein [Burkholderiales bacterium]
MKRTAALLLLALASSLATAQLDPKNLPDFPSEQWFSLARTSTGYLAGGNLAGTLWAFHVRGDELKKLGEGDPPTFAINGVLLQVKAVSRTVLETGRGGILQAHKKYEQGHQAQTSKGVAFGDHDLCRNAAVPHQQWIARAPSGLTQAFVTFEVGDYVLMVVSAYEDEKRRQAVVRAVDDLCRSFKREKAS